MLRIRSFILVGALICELKYRTKKPQTSSRRNRKIPPKQKILRTLMDGAAYAGQQRSILRLPCTPSLLSTTVTTGVISAAIQIGSGQITGFTSRFGSTFDEFRILKCKVDIRSVTASTGVSVMFFDEKSISAPTANESFERIGSRCPNTNAKPNPKSMVWKARDLLDLQYTAIGGSVTPVTFKVYTDTANWGAPSSVTALWIIEPTLTIEFRGLKST